MNYTDIRFPNLGIVFHHVGKSISIGNFQIMYYGIIIGCGFILGFLVSQWEAKRSGQNPELYLDYLLCMMIPAILGARIYYVIFTWDYYGKHPMEILNIRNGGLGIVGGVAMSALVLFIFCKVRKVHLFQMMDTLTLGLTIGQIIGRWGNFFNREAFGGFTNGPLAMQIPVPFFEQFGRLGEIQATGLLDHAVNLTVNGQTIPYIQVHPTFLYEGMVNLVVFLVIFAYRKRKKYHGDLSCIYLMGYGVGRFLVESLRVDQLTIGNTGIAATQVVCILLILLGLFCFFNRRIRRVAPNA